MPHRYKTCPQKCGGKNIRGKMDLKQHCSFLDEAKVLAKRKIRDRVTYKKQAEETDGHPEQHKNENPPGSFQYDVAGIHNVVCW